MGARGGNRVVVPSSWRSGACPAAAAASIASGESWQWPGAGWAFRRNVPFSVAIACNSLRRWPQHPELLQVLVCQIAQNIGVHRVRVESSLVLFEGPGSEPTPDPLSSS